MKVHELIHLLYKYNPYETVVIERDDEYWHIADVDGARLRDRDDTNPVWDYDAEGTPVNAVRICM